MAHALAALQCIGFHGIVQCTTVALHVCLESSSYIHHSCIAYPSRSMSEFQIVCHLLMLHHSLNRYLFLIVCHPGKIMNL